MNLQTSSTIAHGEGRAHTAVMRIGQVLLQNHPAPMWLLDGQGFVIFQNAAADEELLNRACLQRNGARLQVSGDRADAALSAHVRGLHGEGPGSRAAMDLRRRATEPPLWLHFFVLKAFEEQPSGGHASVLVTLFDPGRITVLNAQALTALFQLTMAEARVASAVAEGLTAVQIGKATGTEVSTVRSHLRRIRVKLGARRTADAIRLLKQGEALWNSLAT
jgi:DNA-binding CsgD family transcriptional regulator